MVELDRQELVDTLAQLVQIPSINSDLVPGADGEREIAAWIANRLDKIPGVDVELQDAGQARPNVIATLGSGNGRTLLLNGHVDTVGIEGMSEPHSGRVAGNRLYGRGAFDMKGALAGMIVLMDAAARAGGFPGRLVATFVVDEEYASIGTQALVRELDRWQPDAALVLEATDLQLGVAHRGFVWAQIVTNGFAAHGSRWQVGVDAIAKMGRVLVDLEELGRELTSRAGHPLLGPASIHASLIRGGQELSSYPEHCWLDIERRTLSGETAEQVRTELQTILDRLAATDPTFSAELSIGLERPPFEISPEESIVRALETAIRTETGASPQRFGAAAWMDSALLAQAGVPTAIFGPSGEGAHGFEEWVELDSLERFTRILARVAYDFCGNQTG